VLKLREGLAWQEVAGELVVLDLDGMVLRGLNPSGARAWALLDGRRTLGEVAALLATRYSLPAERALGDLVAFAGDLLRRGLLVPASAAPP
jgi:pyrroloquinoline quinone biosynthesis protein D